MIMMKIRMHNAINPFKDVSDTEMNFESYLRKIDFSKIKSVSQKYKNIKNVIVIGNGGSINPLLSLYSNNDLKIKNLYVVNTEDADLIKDVKKNAKAKDSIVIIASKSGETSTALIDYFAFSGYKKLILTSDENSTLATIAEKNKNDICTVPKNISGRYSGFTETTLIPMAILGYDPKVIINAAAYTKRYKKKAKELAWFFYDAEKNGYSDLFVPIYSYKARGFFNMISQLFHESFGKNREGLTVYGGNAPETQHHTNQRFFGGMDNTSAMIIYAKSENQMEAKVKKSLLSIQKLEKIKGIRYSDAVYYEFLGTAKTAIKNMKVTATIEFESFGIEERSHFLMLLYYFSVYSSLYRKVNPFDQPEVEESKITTMRLIEKKRRIKGKNISGEKNAQLN